MKFIPSLDKNFYPLVVALEEYEEKVKSIKEKDELIICVERNNGYNFIYKNFIFTDNTGHDNETFVLFERILKTILYLAGGYKIIISGSKQFYNNIKETYSLTGKRKFDVEFMEQVYEEKFEVLFEEDSSKLVLKEETIQINNDLSGNRIGFDAGGSDRKVSALVDGKCIFSEETVWNPKTNSDPQYHYNGILESMKKAASYMNNKVDAIGVSSAGIYINNRTMMASLFLQVGKEDFQKTVKNIYIDVAKEFGDVPLVVANDGDVAALAGAKSLNDTGVLGIAMGTSEAVGYVDLNGNIKGWLNELAFVPVDLNENSLIDEWSGDVGCGVKYFSQDSVIKLAENNGFKFDEGLTPAQKLKVIQKLNEENDTFANEIFENIGVYLAYALSYYSKFYDLKHVLLLGRVVSGKGGNTILDICRSILPEINFELTNLVVELPDEKTRRVGQSEAAAMLPSL
ncbi:MAG: ROK family protein [Bacilli bacterium]|jgi:predicted NBD/HSP70 family sugar kinase|nr:ROK family protein [Bacilli bacterium]